MHRLTCHGSLPNRSDRIRWSLDLRYNPTGQHTGRPVFPGFVARSRRNPDSELDDPAVWAGLWRQARRVWQGMPTPPTTAGRAITRPVPEAGHSQERVHQAPAGVDILELAGLSEITVCLAGRMN